MKTFQCGCGHTVFFENLQCIQCQKRLGFDPVSMQLLSFVEQQSGVFHNPKWGLFKPCRNGRDYQVCNWVLPHDSPNHYCISCDLNEMVPALRQEKKRQWWSNMETAKRRLLFTLLRLGLPLQNRKYNENGLAFSFLEDKRSNPYVKEEFVQTGHDQGLITVYLAEADDVRREFTRVTMGEDYRTLLGHFRHESGHYYFDRLICPGPYLAAFNNYFGDHTLDYDEAIKSYYANPPPPAWKTGFITDYAQSHPMEDWAECWAHYLHMIDTLETAADFNIVDTDPLAVDLEDWLNDWDRVTVVLNALNRSMGMRDAYPFVFSESTIEKIRFVHSVVRPMRTTN